MKTVTIVTTVCKHSIDAELKLIGTVSMHVSDRHGDLFPLLHVLAKQVSEMKRNVLYM